MLQSRHIPLFVRFFNYYSRFMIRRHFRQVRYHDEVPTSQKPLLVIANHFSWWDGFFVVDYNHRFLHRKFHVMMLEEQLSRRSFLNKAGAFSIKKGGRNTIESLQYAATIMDNPKNLLLMFPQGEIQSQHQCRFHFEKGVSTIINNTKTHPDILFMAHLTEYYSSSKPSLDVYNRLNSKSFTNIRDLENAYTAFFSESIERQKPE
ncbi:MAG: lysophospholipid acyltransferase family protein [Bacteroidota bacterium]